MADRLTDLILSLTPEDGSSIGNNAMMARLREHVPDLEDADYVAAGLLRRGKGRGGSIIRVGAAQDDGGAEGDPDFGLSPTEAPASRQREAAGRKKAARKKSASKAQGPGDRGQVSQSGTWASV